MKATGVVRRIDELGRIVIPKEIRKTLRIREGENLEIFLDDQENIVLKKYFALNHFVEEAKTFVNTIYHLTRHSVIITDTDKVIAMAGVEKELLDQKPISEQLKDIIARRDKMFEKNKKKIQVVEKQEMEVCFSYATIIANGDACGLVLTYSKDAVKEEEKEFIELTALVLSKQLEN